jgi:hypothetical protein
MKKPRLWVRGISLLWPALRRKPAAFSVILNCYRMIAPTAESACYIGISGGGRRVPKRAADRLWVTQNVPAQRE